MSSPNHRGRRRETELVCRDADLDFNTRGSDDDANPEVDVGPVVQGPGPRKFHPDLLTHPQIHDPWRNARFGRRALASALAQLDSGNPFRRRRAGGWDIEHNS